MGAQPIAVMLRQDVQAERVRHYAGRFRVEHTQPGVNARHSGVSRHRLGQSAEGLILGVELFVPRVLVKQDGRAFPRDLKRVRLSSRESVLHSDLIDAQRRRHILLARL